MTIPVLFSLNNPALAPILIMIACFGLGIVAACIVFLLARKRFVYRTIETHTKGALRARDTHIRALNDEVAQLKEANAAIKAKMGVMTLFITKALTEAKLDATAE